MPKPSIAEIQATLARVAAATAPTAATATAAQNAQSAADAQLAEEYRRAQEKAMQKKKRGALGGSIGGTLGTIAGIAAAPFTGGTSLLIPVAMGAGGAMAGSAAGQGIASGEVDPMSVGMAGLGGAAGGLTAGLGGIIGSTVGSGAASATTGGAANVAQGAVAPAAAVTPVTAAVPAVPPAPAVSGLPPNAANLLPAGTQAPAAPATVAPAQPPLIPMDRSHWQPPSTGPADTGEIGLPYTGEPTPSPVPATQTFSQRMQNALQHPLVQQGLSDVLGNIQQMMAPSNSIPSVRAPIGISPEAIHAVRSEAMQQQQLDAEQAMKQASLGMQRQGLQEKMRQNEFNNRLGVEKLNQSDRQHAETLDVRKGEALNKSAQDFENWKLKVADQKLKADDLAAKGKDREANLILHQAQLEETRANHATMAGIAAGTQAQAAATRGLLENNREFNRNMTVTKYNTELIDTRDRLWKTYVETTYPPNPETHKPDIPPGAMESFFNAFDLAHPAIGATRTDEQGQKFVSKISPDTGAVDWFPVTSDEQKQQTKK